MKVGAAGERIYVLSYDIADDLRRQRLSRYLERQGRRVQWSVFEIIANERRMKALLTEICDDESMFDAAGDSVRCYPLCARCRTGIEVRGIGRSVAEPGSPIVL